MNGFAKTAALLFAGVLAASSSLPAGIIVDKSPDLGAYWQPLDGTPSGTYVYANSFLFTGTTGTLMDTVGIYLLNNSASSGTPFRFEVYADAGNAPDPLTVLGVTGYQQVANPSLALVTNTLLTPISLTSGVQYWIAASTVGQPSSGSYQVGGHTQNSIYSDNGTFWYSNDPAGLVFDGQDQTPEIGIYASSGLTAVPEPASLALAGVGAAGLWIGTLRRRRQRAV